MRQERPFIHTFVAGNNYYLYDVNTDKILQIPENVYQYLKNNPSEQEIEKISETEAKSYILRLKDKGFLKTTRVQESEHPETRYVSSYLNSQMTSIILQVTQNCNLRCEYCVYSGSYYNRVHNNKRMSFDLARKGIDFLAAHSADSETLHIGFYGGEPLLEFELIKKCIDYAYYRCDGKKLYFNLTTNGTLLTREMVDYFCKHGVLMMFSLDGPKQIHDMSRKSINNEGSFEKLIANVQMIKEEYPKYFEEKISFNTVLNSERSYSCVSDYISGEELLKDKLFMSSMINTHNAKIERAVSEQFIKELRYEYFMVLLSKINQISDKAISPLARPEAMRLDELRFEKNIIGRTQLPCKYHHGGPCVPGNYRVFMDVEGNFYPCERVSETSKEMRMGDISRGIDVEQAKKIMNVEKMTADTCHNCWAYDYCNVCVADINTSYDCPAASIVERCKEVRSGIEEKFKDYCVLKMYGYQY